MDPLPIGHVFLGSPDCSWFAGLWTSVCSLGLPVTIMSWAGQAPPPLTQETINIYQVPTTHWG